MSRIIIDGRMYGESGIGRYIKNLIANLQIIDKENDYFVFLLKDDYDRLVYHNNFHKILADFRWYGAVEQFKLPQLLKSLKPDLVHFPHFNAPLLYDGKFIVTIHDLIHQHFSMQRATTHGLVIYKLKQFGYKKIFKNALRKSEKILVPSSFVKEQLKEQLIDDWKIDASKVVVTHEAVDDKILDISQKPKAKSQKLLEKFNIKKPYIFYVGNAHPHKNVEGLIKAFLIIKKNYPKLKLVLAGHDHYFWKRVKKEFQDEDIIYAGFISDDELVVLYKNAEMFVMPSFEEGFGIPLLEAFACSCPVVSSDAGSLTEVGGDAAIYFDSHSVHDIVDKVSLVLSDENFKRRLVKNGLRRYKQFSWQRLAEKTLEVYLKCV